MDLRSWRKALLQWITECNFMERNYFNIEQTNIDAFFGNFCLKHNAAKDFNSITTFLQNHYPKFQLSLDKENTLTTEDYVYVYSLLLHFSCVKCPDKTFHGICQKLGEPAQQCIAVFFQDLHSCPSIDKEQLRHAIAKVATIQIFSPPGPQNKNESSCSSGSSAGAISIDLQTSYSSSPLRVSNNDSLMRTPNRKVAVIPERISPGTPKTHLLEEQTRELFKYKAELETERYEKGLLELQITQNEQQISNLYTTQTNLRQQIQSLRNEILNQSAEPNGHPVEDDQIKKQLYRQINEREDEIFRLNDRIRIFDEEKTLLENKLRHAESKILDYRETISELELQLNEYATDMEKKDFAIKCLTDEKAELEHFIAESRTASSNSRPEFNSSSDCLDSSYARYTNSSGSLSSPENLGASVVDVQLREKEHENVQLREELTELRCNNKKLSIYIQEKTQMYKKEFNLEITDATAISSDKDDPAADFSIFLDYMNYLSQSYMDAKEHIKQLEADICSQKVNNDDLKVKIEASKLEIQRCNNNVTKLTEDIERTKKEKDKLKEEMSQSYKTAIEDLNAKLKESAVKQVDLSSYNERLNEKIHHQMRIIESSEGKIIEEEAFRLDLQKKFDEVQSELIQLKAENQNLEDTTKLLNCKLQANIESEELTKQKNQQLFCQNEELLQKLNATNAHLKTLGNDIQTKEEELNKVGKEIVQLNRINGELEERLQKLMQTYNDEKLNWETQNRNLQKNLMISEVKLKKLSQDIDDVEIEKEEICKQIELLYILFKEQKNSSNAIVTLRDINKIVTQILINREEDTSRISELENKQKENNDMEKKLLEEIEINAKRLIEHKAEIKEISEQLLKASAKIEELETLLKEMESKKQEMVRLEQKRTKEVEKINEKLQEERQSWRNKQEQLKAELSGEKELYAANVKELSMAKQQLESYELQLRELKCNKSETEKDYLEKLTVAQAKVEEFSKENEELKAKLDIQSQEIISKAKEVSSYIEKLDQTVQALKSAKLEREQMQKTMENLEIDNEKKILAIKETIERMSKEKIELEQLLTTERKRLETKIKELSDCSEENNKTLLELKTAQINLNELKENMETERNKFLTLENGLKAKLNGLKKENEKLQCNNQFLETKLKAEVELREELEKSKDSYKNSFEVLQEEKQKLEENMSKRVEEKQKCSESLLLLADAEIKQIRNELQKTTEELEERNKELQDVRNILKEVSEKLENEMKISEALKLSNENQKADLEKLRIKVHQFEEMQEKKYLEIESLHTTIKKQSDDLFLAYEEIANLKEDLKQNIEQIQKLQSDLVKASNVLENHHKCANEIIGLNTKLQSLQCDQRKMNAELEQVIKKNDEAEKQNDKFNEIIKEQEQKIEELRERLRQTERSLKEVNDECTKSQGEVVAKEAEIRILSDEIKQIEHRLKTQDVNASETIKELEQDIEDVVTALLNSSIIGNFENDDVPLTKGNNKQSVNNLKKAVNRALIAIDHQHKSLMEIPNLQCRLKELNEQKAKVLLDFKEVQLQFRVAQAKIDKLEDEKKLLEKNIDAADKRYADNLQNLEQVNEKLSSENETVHSRLLNKIADLETLEMNFDLLKAVNEQLKIAQDKQEVEYNKTIESLNREQNRLKEIIDVKETALGKLQQQHDKLKIFIRDETVSKQENLESIRSEVMQLKSEMTKQLEELQIKQQECTALAAENQEIQTKNAELNTQVVELQKECISLRGELSTLNEKIVCANEELATSLDQIEEASSNCNSYYEKLEKLNAKYTLLEINFKEMEVQLNTSNSEFTALMVKYTSLIQEKQNLIEELNVNKRESHELKQTIHNLNQKLALGDLEKDDLRRQLELLHKQVEVNGRYQTSSESKLKNIVETSQALERNLLCTENALKTTRATLEQSKVNVEKLETENQKLNHSLDNVNKRIEKLALKLGESQAQTLKSERENDKLTKSIETQKITIETLQREKDLQQLECKTLKERLNRTEQQLARVQNTEKSNTSLMAEKQKLETAEVDLKAKITKLKNSCQINEDRLRKMTHNYERCERENVSLNHQIGALNNEIRMLKSGINDANNAKIIELNKTIAEIRLQSKEFEEQNEKLSCERNKLQQQNQNLTDQLSKVVLALEMSKAKIDQLGTEVQQLEVELKKLHQEKICMEQQAQNNITEQIETQKRLISEKRKLEERIQVYEDDLTSKDAEINSLRQKTNELRQNANENSSCLADKASKLVSEVESLRTRLLAAEVTLEKEQENNAKLRSDNQILLAKYGEAKQRIEAEVTSSEERIKENRLELEGKLEKMKNKMKVLYTEEVTKMKTKQERETATMRSEISLLKSQNTKYQEHVQKLSTELMTLNDRMLECQKQNTHLITKLKYVKNEEQFKRPNGAITPAVATIPRISSVQSIPTNIGSDLAMEDEEGEMFNNTYLADLKNGRMSEIAPEELQRRNSLFPPHLKSSYAVQYDHGLCEDEVKDGTSNILDDSTSALLNSNSSCIRKKLMGVTNYHKPGPPTPSKHTGRLSLGGNSEPSREILKESYDENTPTSTKTPARFGFFASKFSMGSNYSMRDENEEDQQQEQQQQLYNNNNHEDRQKLFVKEAKMDRKDLIRRLQIKNMEKFKNCNKNRRISGERKICTSTPRKSHGRMFDRRCLIKEIQEAPLSASVVDTFNSSHEIVSPFEFSDIETPPTAFDNIQSRRPSITFVKRSVKAKRMSTESSTGAVVMALQRRIRKGARREREQGNRPSLCVSKNLYTSKVCTPQRGAIRDLKRILGRKNRMLRFDNQRMLSNNNTSSSNAEVSEIDIEAAEKNEELKIPVVDRATFALENINHATVVLATHEIEASGKQETSGTEQNHLRDNSDVATKSDNQQNSKNSCSAVTASSVVPKMIIPPTLHIETLRFDKHLDNLQEEIYSENGASSIRFEQLLKETVSQAPFEIRNIHLSSIGADHSDSCKPSTTNFSSTDHLIDRTSSNANSLSSNAAVFGKTRKQSSTCDMAYTTVTATPHQSPLSPSSLLQHSRTIYGASVIFNPRIPNVDGLRARKSSIYFKNPKCSTFRSSCGLSAIDSNATNPSAFSQEGDLILVTNQTITLYDLICMWQQMNAWTRLFIFVLLSGSMGAILTLLGFLYLNR